MKSKKVKWGIISTANIARTTLIPAFQRSGNSEVVAISSRGEKAISVAKELHIAKAYTTYEELLQDPDIEAVYIPLPNNLHKEWVIKAAEAKKHILVEKPAGLTAAEVKDMIEACEANGVLLMEAFMYRFHEQHQKVKQLIEQGQIGDIRMMRASFSFMLGDSANIRTQPELGGGALYDIGCYAINSIRMFLGEPERIIAEGDFTDKGVDTTVHAILSFSNQIKAVFDCSFQMPSRNEYEIIGTKGSIRVPYAYRPDLNEGLGIIKLSTQTSEEIIEVYSDQYRGQVEHFSECILTGQTPSYSIHNTYLNMKVIDEVYAALKNK